MTKRSLAIYVLIALAAAGLDQWVKRLVVANMELHESIAVAPMQAKRSSIQSTSRKHRIQTKTIQLKKRSHYWQK